MKQLSKNELENFYKAILSLKTIDECDAFFNDIGLGRRAIGGKKQPPEIDLADAAKRGKAGHGQTVFGKAAVDQRHGGRDQRHLRPRHVLAVQLSLRLIDRIVYRAHCKHATQLALLAPGVGCGLELLQKRLDVAQMHGKGPVGDFGIKVDGVAAAVPNAFDVIGGALGQIKQGVPLGTQHAAVVKMIFLQAFCIV